ncbi:MAG: hypothetical protein GX295_11075 [Syntrophomonadaceae bacterium]|nr:hypothetical protein [Syntrophomonadaceae bacterium]
MIGYRQSTPEQPDNAESAWKCLNCGNMFSASLPGCQCDLCGVNNDPLKTRRLGVSNEDY